MRARERPPPALPASPARPSGGGSPHCTPRPLPAVTSAPGSTLSDSRRGSPQSHAMASHLKQSNTFPMSLEDFQQYLFSLRSGSVFAALVVCHHYAQLCVSASISLCKSAAPTCVVACSPTAARRGVTLQAKQHPPLCPWRTFNKIYSTSVLGSCLPRSPCATTTRNCASPLRYR